MNLIFVRNVHKTQSNNKELPMYFDLSSDYNNKDVNLTLGLTN
jgi:hypothetical protein